MRRHKQANCRAPDHHQAITTLVSGRPFAQFNRTSRPTHCNLNDRRSTRCHHRYLLLSPLLQPRASESTLRISDAANAYCDTPIPLRTTRLCWTNTDSYPGLGGIKLGPRHCQEPQAASLHVRRSGDKSQASTSAPSCCHEPCPSVICCRM